MNNPMEFIKAIKNPQEFVLNVLGTNTDPMVKTLLKMAKNNDREGIESIARDIFKQQGQDFDQIMSIFK